jgi:hypothetical protein
VGMAIGIGRHLNGKIRLKKRTIKDCGREQRRVSRQNVGAKAVSKLSKFILKKGVKWREKNLEKRRTAL